VIGYVLALEIALLATLAVGLGTWQRDANMTGRLTFCALCGAVALAALGELLVVRGLSSELFADRVKYFGMMVIPALWLGFAAHLAHLDVARRVPWFPLLLLVPSAFLYGFLLDDRFGVLFLTTVEGGPDRYGPLWWVNLAYSQLLGGLGSSMLAISALRSPMLSHRVQRGGMALAGLVPMAGNLAYLFGSIEVAGDPTMILLGVSVLILRSSFESTGLLESVPIAPRELLHQLPISVILADGRDCIVEMSDLASNRLGVFEEFALGRVLEDVLQDAPNELKIESVEIRQRNQPAGRLVLLR
jgi:hypothetical protein